MKKIILILLWIIPMAGHASEMQKKQCELVHVKIGDRVFELKNTSGISLEKDRNFLTIPLCFGNEIPLIEVDQMHFMLRAIPETLMAKKFQGNFQVIISHYQYDDSVSIIERSQFNRVKNTFERNGINYRELPVTDGFYNDRGILYISHDPNFVTPLGVPVVFDGAKTYSTTYFISDGLSVGVRMIPRKYYPPSELKEFYHNLTQTIANLDITDQFKGE